MSTPGRERWTHLIRFNPGEAGRPAHTGYATFRQGNASQPDHLIAVGDNVHAPGQTVAVLNQRPQGNAFGRGPRWETRAGQPLEVLQRPARGQIATEEAPHRVTVWQTEFCSEEGAHTEGCATLCIPWIRYEAPNGELKWDPAPFRPTCDEVARKIEDYERLRRRGRTA